MRWFADKEYRHASHNFDIKVKNRNDSRQGYFKITQKGSLSRHDDLYAVLLNLRDYRIGICNFLYKLLKKNCDIYNSYSTHFREN